MRPRVAVLAALLFMGVTAIVVSAERSAAAMATAAGNLVNSLTPAQRQRAFFPFDAGGRTRWNFIPTEYHRRGGLRLSDMTPAQKDLAHALLKTALSARGYMTATQVMGLEAILQAMENTGYVAERGGATRALRDPEQYFFTVFGAPSTRETWGWRVEGHHLSLHFTVVTGMFVASSPTFFGSNPGEVREGPHAGLRVLAEEEDMGRAFLMSLEPSQRTRAIVSDVALEEIATSFAEVVTPLSPEGIAAASMTARQRDMLMALIDIYVSKMAIDIAEDRMKKLRDAGLEKITFAWAGSIERGKKHYYKVQGPTFLIEYDNAQNNANHVHTVWRDFDGDFGRDLLREHLRAVSHQ